MDKAALRKEMAARLRAMSRAEIVRLSHRVAGAFTALPAWKSADAVLAFLSMPQEIETEPLIAAARAEGKTVAVPVMQDGEITFVVLPPDAGELPRDKWDIPVPHPSWARFDVARAACPLVAVPGLAFDRAGNRLGRGKGYYDRFLTRARAAAPRLSAVAIGFAWQVVEEVPHGPADQAVDGIVTEAGVIAQP